MNDDLGTLILFAIFCAFTWTIGARWTAQQFQTWMGEDDHDRGSDPGPRQPGAPHEPEGPRMDVQASWDLETAWTAYLWRAYVLRLDDTDPRRSWAELMTLTTSTWQRDTSKE